MEAKTLKVEFRESRVGNEMLVINGCKYMINRRSGDTVYWRCIYSWCHSRAVIRSGQLKSANGSHTCPQPQQSETKNSSVQSNSVVAHMDRQVTTTPNISIQSVFSIKNSQCDYQTPMCVSPQKSLISNREVFEFEGLEGIELNLKAESNLDENASTFSTANSSFLEFVEDKSILPKVEVSNEEEFCKADSAWKKRTLANLKVYSEAEQLRRFKIAYSNRNSWCANRKQFSEKLSGCQKKWATSNAIWTHSKDWPTRSHCIKLTKPERGVGTCVEQPLVPVKIIEEVLPIPNFVTSSENKNVQSVNKRDINKKFVKTKKGIFASGNESSNEVQIKEENIKPFKNEGKCPICEKVFQSSLDRHLNVHYGIKPFKCEYCEKTFSQEHSYRSHVRIHTKDRPFCCTICPKTFTSNGTLKRHIISHSSGRTFPCNICGKRFRKAEFLQFHSSKCRAKEHKSTTESTKYSTSIPMEVGNGENVTIIASPGKRNRRVPRKFAEVFEESSLSENLVRELRKRKQQMLQDRTDSNLEGESSSAATHQFSLEELKYADFLQPKVVLSNVLSVFITHITSDASAQLNTAKSNLLFHNYAKPIDP